MKNERKQKELFKAICIIMIIIEQDNRIIAPIIILILKGYNKGAEVKNNKMRCAVLC